LRLRTNQQSVLITIQIANRQKTLPLDRRRIRRAVRTIVTDAHFADAQISVTVVDDPMIAKLHQQYLHDPDPTDVLSFLLEQSAQVLEGEVIASAEMARACAPKYACTPAEELLRYVIHGTLHLVGYDDTTPRKRAVMKRKEEQYLRLCDKRTKERERKHTTATRRTRSGGRQTNA
jgi:probable rRNA maturation factor